MSLYSTEVWQLAEQFGATCTKELSKRTTHVIAARKGTSKVNSAQRRRDISIVTLAWLLNSVNLWRRQPESVYLLDAGSSPQHSDGVPSTSGYPSPSNTAGKEEGDELEDDAHFDDMDWGDAEAEIQAFLEETDDEDSRSDIFTPEEDSLPDGTAEGTDGKKRTLSASQHSESSSPLAKRRRVAAARVGRSKLKMSESADAPSADNADDASKGGPASSLLVKDASQENADTDDDDLDDFAKALEGELQ
jgi:RNA polymerase II subunit A-like phosphatase